MVQEVSGPRENPWGKALGQFAGGAVEGYTQQADEMALQKAVGDLPPNAAPKDVLNAILKTKTYSPEAKQQLFKNVMGVAEYEQAQQKLQNEAANKQAKQAEKDQKEETNRASAKALISQSDLAPEQKQQALADIEAGNLNFEGAKALFGKAPAVSDYDVATNQGKRFENRIKDYDEKAVKADALLPIIQTTIQNNEQYTDPEKYWDAYIDFASGLAPQLAMFKSARGQALDPYTAISIQSLGQKMGGILTNARQKLLEKKAFSLGKDKSANRLILYSDLYSNKLDKLRSRFTHEIISQNRYGLAPADLDAQIEAKMKPYQNMIWGDLQRMVNGEMPVSPLANRDYEDVLKPGYVLMMDQKGNTYQLPEEEVDLPDNQDLIRFTDA